jgi:alpha-ketoglutarate-dependent taurine dioxygenase
LRRCHVGAEWPRNLRTDPSALSDGEPSTDARRKPLFRDQDITRAEHVAFARHFGELEDHPVAGSDPENPGLVRIYKTPDTPNGVVRTHPETGETSPTETP